MQSNPVPLAATVLVVDDEFLVRLYVADSLREEGFQVIEAVNGDEAVSILRTSAPVDIVVTDFRMPGTMDGVGLARFIRERRPQLKIIMTSGDRVEPPAGCQLDGFFVKPYSLADLVKLIRSLPQGRGSSNTE
jgi:CheY-like chemotaxis protein